MTFPSPIQPPYHFWSLWGSQQEHSSVPRAAGPTPDFLFFPVLCKHTSIQSSDFPFNSSFASCATPLKYLRGSLLSPSWARQTLRSDHWLLLVCSAVGLSAFSTGLPALAKQVSFAQCWIWRALNKAWQKVGTQYILTERVFTFTHQNL